MGTTAGGATAGGLGGLGGAGGRGGVGGTTAGGTTAGRGGLGGTTAGGTTAGQSFFSIPFRQNSFGAATVPSLPGLPDPGTSAA
ncbi:MAG: hypothetical protein ACKOHK_04570, partial [Planctomycetia bacterium]